MGKQVSDLPAAIAMQYPKLFFPDPVILVDRGFPGKLCNDLMRCLYRPAVRGREADVKCLECRKMLSRLLCLPNPNRRQRNINIPGAAQPSQRFFDMRIEQVPGDIKL